MLFILKWINFFLFELYSELNLGKQHNSTCRNISHWCEPVIFLCTKVSLFLIGFVAEEGRFESQVKLERISFSKLGIQGQKYSPIDQNNQRKLMLSLTCFESQLLIIQTDGRESLPDNSEL